MARKERGGSEPLKYLLVGFAAAGLAVLFAPRSGRETRRLIADWLDFHEEDPTFVGRLTRLLPLRHRISAAMRDGHESWEHA